MHLPTSFIKISISLILAGLLLPATLFTLGVQAVDPLPNGVAAGDTTAATTVLWTRATTTGLVAFAYSTDAAFHSNVLTVTATVSDVLHPVKVEITDLSPATTYFYRVSDAAGVAASGRFRTASLDTFAGLRFGVSGDWKSELAPYPSINNADDRALDFFVEHGDTIVAQPSQKTVEAYLLKHNEVYSTYQGLNTWADLRSSTSILAMIDDNDVRNDFAGGADPSSNADFDDTGDFINETNRYRNALQAFLTYNPLRDEFYDETGDPRTANKRRLYRFRTYGRDAAVFLLDARSFRDKPLDPPNLDGPDISTEILLFLQASFIPTRTMLGEAQLATLKADLLQAQADGLTWKFILTTSPIQNLGLPKAVDRFEGYAAERTDLLRFIHQNGIENVVFIAGSIHGTIVNNLTYQETPLGTPKPVKAFEATVGPVAIDPPSGPFGPEVVELAFAQNLFSQEEKDDYDNRSREGKDQFVKAFLDDKVITPLNYDPIGLDGSTIEAVLLQGDYVSLHTYGWTEFDIDEETQRLTVTTYGVDFYTADELNNDPDSVTKRTPAIVSQFIVTPTLHLNSIYLPAVLKN